MATYDISALQKGPLSASYPHGYQGERMGKFLQGLLPSLLFTLELLFDCLSSLSLSLANMISFPLLSPLILTALLSADAMQCAPSRRVLPPMTTKDVTNLCCALARNAVTLC